MLSELVPAIHKTAELVQEVATASREQSAGVAQVNRAMNQVDQVTQRNAASAEELSGTAAGMAAQAEHLQQLMTVFRAAEGNPSVGARAELRQPALAAPEAHQPSRVSRRQPANQMGVNEPRHGSLASAKEERPVALPIRREL